MNKSKLNICIVCGKRSTRVRNINGINRGFCADHGIKDLKTLEFWELID